MIEKSRNFKKINQSTLYKFNQHYFRRLNDIYIDTSAVVEYLNLAANLKDQTLLKRVPGNIQVPSDGGQASVRRTPKQITEIFRIAAETGQWEKSLTFAISLTEDLVASYIKLILRAKPLLIMTSLKGNDASVNVSLAEIIKSGTEKVMEDRVQQRVTGAIYASPEEYGKYLGALLQFEFPMPALGPYVETKARRDLIIHAGGVANSIYLDKAKGYTLGTKMGDKISVDRVYFEESVRVMKRLANAIYKQAVKQYGDDVEINEVMETRGI